MTWSELERVIKKTCYEYNAYATEEESQEFAQDCVQELKIHQRTFGGNFDGLEMQVGHLQVVCKRASQKMLEQAKQLKAAEFFGASAILEELAQNLTCAVLRTEPALHMQETT